MISEWRRERRRKVVTQSTGTVVQCGRYGNILCEYNNVSFTNICFKYIHTLVIPKYKYVYKIYVFRKKIYLQIINKQKRARKFVAQSRMSGVQWGKWESGLGWMLHFCFNIYFDLYSKYMFKICLKYILNTFKCLVYQVREWARMDVALLLQHIFLTYF